MGRSIINFDTDKLVIFTYPWGAGGKFLVNCLGLSDDAVFQHCVYAGQQLDENFSQSDKIDYIRKKLDEVGDEWTDLDLGCCQLTTIYNKDYLKMSAEDMRNNPDFHPVISNLTQRNSEYFFMVSHEQETLDAYLKVWPNAKIINLKNYNVMRNLRNLPKIHQWIYHPNCLFHWDCNWFLDPEKTVENIKKLYDLLELSGFNKDFILEYRKKWLNIIS
jgi:hypothetical protein